MVGSDLGHYGIAVFRVLPPSPSIEYVESPVLDDLDHRIIHALYVDGRVSFSRMAEVLGGSEQTIARRYRRMRDEHGVRVVGQLDSQRLGRSDWAVRIRCTPDAATPVATALAKRPDTGWVQLTSGGTEISCMVNAHDEQRRATLLLEQLPASSRIVALEAFCLLHVFTSATSAAPGAEGLTPEEVDRLAAPGRVPGLPADRPAALLSEDDWPLVRALEEDGRATHRELAARTHRHESTVRRRVEDLVGSGTLYFDLDVDSELLGLRSRANLWASVAPSALMAVGAALTEHREVPFVAATTGRTNLMASLACSDDVALFEFLTREIAGLDGVTHLETSPVIRSLKMHTTLNRPL
jgi:DNA-binding Lrp family transcriptional regulator